MKITMLGVLLIISTISFTQDLYSVPVKGNNSDKKMILVSTDMVVDDYGNTKVNYIGYDKSGKKLNVYTLRENRYYVYINHNKYYFKMK